MSQPQTQPQTHEEAEQSRRAALIARGIVAEKFMATTMKEYRKEAMWILSELGKRINAKDAGSDEERESAQRTAHVLGNVLTSLNGVEAGGPVRGAILAINGVLLRLEGHEADDPLNPIPVLTTIKNHLSDFLAAHPDPARSAAL